VKCSEIPHCGKRQNVGGNYEATPYVIKSMTAST
jgi:hypothetical protein